MFTFHGAGLRIARHIRGRGTRRGRNKLQGNKTSIFTDDKGHAGSIWKCGTLIWLAAVHGVEPKDYLNSMDGKPICASSLSASGTTRPPESYHAPTTASESGREGALSSVSAPHERQMPDKGKKPDNLFGVCGPPWPSSPSPCCSPWLLWDKWWPTAGNSATRRLRLPRVQRGDRPTNRPLHPGQHLRHLVGMGTSPTTGGFSLAVTQGQFSIQTRTPPQPTQNGPPRLFVRHHLVVLRLDGPKRGNRFGSLRSRRPLRQRQQRRQRRHLRHHVGHRQRSRLDVLQR